MTQGRVDRREHWDIVYSSKPEDAVSWFQSIPEVSLALVAQVVDPASARVIDVGGGTSRLVDHLLEGGARNVSVLDVSERALQVVRDRLGEAGRGVEWLSADVTEFRPPHQWDLWHDRAVFHFLTDPGDRAAYRGVLLDALPEGGYAIIAAFAPDGPTRCSGLEVVRYDPSGLLEALEPGFELVDFRRESHLTPAGAEQPFVYTVLRRIAAAPRGGGA